MIEIPIYRDTEPGLQACFIISKSAFISVSGNEKYPYIRKKNISHLPIRGDIWGKSLWQKS